MIEIRAITRGTIASNDAEYECQHYQCPQATEQPLGEQAHPTLLRTRRRQCRETAEVNGATRDSHPAECRARSRRGFLEPLEPRAAGLRRWIGEQERGAPVTRDERAVAGTGVGRDPGTRDRLRQSAFDSLKAALHRGRVDARARRERDDGYQRRAVAAVSERARDRGIGLPGFAAGDRVFVAECFCRRANRSDPDDHDDQPEGGDDTTVAQHEPRDAGHRAGERAASAACWSAAISSGPWLRRCARAESRCLPARGASLRGRRHPARRRPGR